MSIKVVRDEVRDALAKIHSGEGVDALSDNTVIRRWDNIRADQIEDAVDYLQNYTSSKNGDVKKMYVTDLMIDKTTLDGVWRVGKVSQKRSDDGSNYSVFQELHKGFIQTVKNSEQYDFSEFLIEDGDLWHSGASQPILRLPNVDPAFEDAIRRELQASDTYTEIKTRFETLPGQYYYINTKPRPESDGSFSILLFLSKHNNTDLYFKYWETPYTIKGFYYKWDATDETINEVLQHQLFDNDSGDLADPPELLRITHGINIGDFIGKDLKFSKWYKGHAQYSWEDGDEWIIAGNSMQGYWNFADSIITGNVSQKSYVNPSAAIPPETGWTPEPGVNFTILTLSRYTENFGSYTKNVATLQEGVIGRTVAKNRFDRDDNDRLFDLEIEITWVFGHSDVQSIGDKTTLTGVNINPESDTPTCILPDGTLVTWPEFKTFIAAQRGTFQIKYNPDGTLDYEAALTVAGAAMDVTFAENHFTTVTRHFRYGLDEQDVKNFFERVLVAVPQRFIIKGDE